MVVVHCTTPYTQLLYLFIKERLKIISLFFFDAAGAAESRGNVLLQKILTALKGSIIFLPGGGEHRSFFGELRGGPAADECTSDKIEIR